MSPLNQLMNHIEDLNESNSFFKRQVISRTQTVCLGLPLDVLSVLQNFLKLPWEAALTTIKMPAKIINLCLCSQSLKEFESSKPGPIDLIKTVLKIVGYAIGAISAASLGWLSPRLNFRLHVALHLIVDEKMERARRQVELEEIEQRRILEKAMQAHIQTYLKLYFLKNSEKERLLNKESKFEDEDEKKSETEILEKVPENAMEISFSDRDKKSHEDAFAEVIEKEVINRFEEEKKIIELSREEKKETGFLNSNPSLTNPTESKNAKFFAKIKNLLSFKAMPPNTSGLT